MSYQAFEMERWMEERGGVFTWQRPSAGAVVYARYDLPVDGLTLAEKLRVGDRPASQQRLR